MEIAEGLDLLPGADGRLPVRARWVAFHGTPEASAIDGELIYVVGDALTAYRLCDGSVAWDFAPSMALEASGGVVIGLDGPDIVRVVAPFEYDLRVQRGTGHLLSLEPASDTRPTPLPATMPTRFRIETGYEETIGYWPDGAMAWRLVHEPFVNPLKPLEADGAIALVTTGQHVVVLEPVEF